MQKFDRCDILYEMAKGCDVMFPQIDKLETGINLRRIMDKQGLTVKDVQEYLGLGSVQSIYHWISGKSMPTIDNLYALSYLFQMPLEEIIRGNMPPMKSKLEIDTICLKDRRLLLYFEKLNQNRAA